MTSVNLERISKVIYADWVEASVPLLVRRSFALRSARLAGKRRDMPAHPLESLLDRAEFSGIISFEQANDLLSLEFAATGNTASGEEVYVLVQASDLVRVPDVTFVKRMAGLFRKVVEARVEALVIGEGMSCAAAECACWANVRFVRRVRSQ